MYARMLTCTHTHVICSISGKHKNSDESETKLDYVGSSNILFGIDFSCNVQSVSLDIGHVEMFFQICLNIFHCGDNGSVDAMFVKRCRQP